MSSLRRMLKFRHGLSAWHGDLDNEPISMYRASPMPFCLLHWSDH
jgi:hypothetical protein